MTAQFWIMMGAINGFIAVACGAYGAHGLKRVLTSEMLEVFKTASYYQMVHAVLLVLIGSLIGQGMTSSKLSLSAQFCLAGIVLFSGSLYALSLSNIKILGVITPLGGAAFLASWALLAIAMVKP